jgi:hypothetical protein
MRFSRSRAWVWHAGDHDIFFGFLSSGFETEIRSSSSQKIFGVGNPCSHAQQHRNIEAFAYIERSRTK